MSGIDWFVIASLFFAAIGNIVLEIFVNRQTRKYRDEMIESNRVVTGHYLALIETIKAVDAKVKGETK